MRRAIADIHQNRLSQRGGARPWATGVSGRPASEAIERAVGEDRVVEERDPFPTRGYS
jgi:hypothetical protein